MIKFVVLVLLLWCQFGWAHKASDSYLYFDGSSLRLDIALVDMLRLQNMDLDGDGALRWGELTASQAEFAVRVESALSLRSSQSGACALVAGLSGISEHSDGPYSSWRLSSPCFASPGGTLLLEYNLLFERDPLHRLLYKLADAEGERIGVLSPEQNTVFLTGGDHSLWATAGNFFWQGVIHLVGGFDHVLFLLVLVLPALSRSSGLHTLGHTMRELAWVVSAFTLAHSITLVMASMGWVRFPIAVVETVIAISISIAAALAFWPAQHVQRYLAFGFGLIHGFGFASVLADLLAASSLRVVALASFNIGIEVGQLVLVALALALLFPLREQRWFQRLLPVPLVLAAGVGVMWAVERAGDWL